MRDSFLDSFNTAFMMGHTIENDNRLRKAAEAQAQVHQLQMMKMASELIQQQKHEQFVQSLSSPEMKPVADDIESRFGKGSVKMLQSGVKPSELPKQETPANLEAMLAADVRAGKMSLQDAYKIKKAQEDKPKEVNVGNDIEIILMGMPQFKDYASNPETRKKALEYYANNSETIRNKASQFAQSKAAPFYTVVPTTEGLKPFKARGEGAGEFKEDGTTPKNKPLTEAAAKEFGALSGLMANIKSAEKLYKSDYVGPVAGRFYSIAENLKNLPEDQIKFYSYVRDNKDALLRARSGAQINEQEYARLVKFLPDENLPSGNFVARMKRFEEAVKQIMNEKAKVYRNQGYDINVGEQQKSQQPENQQRKYRILQVR